MDNPHIDDVLQQYAERTESVELDNVETEAVIEKGFQMANDIMIRDSTMSEEDRIFIFQAAITLWCRKYSCQGIGDLSVYDFINRGSSGLITIHYATQVRDSIILNEWDVALLTAYFTSVRPAFIHRGQYPSSKVLVLTTFNELTQSFFVNSTGKDDFKAGNIVIQFVDKMGIMGGGRLPSAEIQPNPTMTADYHLPTKSTLRR